MKPSPPTRPQAPAEPPRRSAGSRLGSLPARARPAVAVLLLLALGMLEITLGGITSAPVLATAGAALLPLLWRRTRPRLVCVTVAAALLNFLFHPELLFAAALAGLMGLYTLTRRRVLHPVLVAGAGVTGALLVNLGHIARGVYDLGEAQAALGTGGRLSHFTEAFVLSVVIVATVSAADALRSREDSRRERRAAQLRLVEMERRQAVAAERAAVARELHDIVAHSVSVIAVRAESATYTTPLLSPQARDGFQQIAESARSTLNELRSLLDVLREDAEDRAALAPQPDLDALPELLETHRSAGGDAELRTTGVRPPRSAPLELTVYRTVQEALTNARRHAPGAAVRIDLDYAGDRIALRILDDGPGPARNTRRPESTGHGLIGMRERAALLGGRFSCGRGPAGGFLIEAELPHRAAPKPSPGGSP
ncbi:sensor histidine kinase [Streptomyces sp. NPDC020141]|uniref:sensor histidine kinase n=1 Tax=Streptomyces sp. NPDC020141 TaxID=3365065 RepID=UPI003790D52F